MQVVLVIIVIAIILGIFSKIWPVILAVIALGIVAAIALHLMKRKYFNSSDFRAHKNRLSTLVAEHNSIASYAEELRENESFQLGISNTGQHAHLATSTNISQHNYRRDRHLATYGKANVHNCSLQVVRNAQADPLKYVVKYFNVEVSEEGLARVERFGDDLSRLENAIDNIKNREKELATGVNLPWYIETFFMQDFYSQVGIELAPIDVPYPVYSFEYVSAGGNSAQETSLKFTSEVVDELIAWMSQKIKFRKSVAGQRALMTKTLRHQIKDRDNHTCQQCGLSVHDEPNLLLEVDHIYPLSKGGMSTIENLQTLCWRCNRTKGAKVIEHVDE